MSDDIEINKVCGNEICRSGGNW